VTGRLQVKQRKTQRARRTQWVRHGSRGEYSASSATLCVFFFKKPHGLVTTLLHPHVELCGGWRRHLRGSAVRAGCSMCGRCGVCGGCRICGRHHRRIAIASVRPDVAGCPDGALRLQRPHRRLSAPQRQARPFGDPSHGGVAGSVVPGVFRQRQQHQQLRPLRLGVLPYPR